MGGRGGGVKDGGAVGAAVGRGAVHVVPVHAGDAWRAWDTWRRLGG